MYFTDTGTLCHLAGLKDPHHALSGPMGGAIFETAVITEVFKTIAGRGHEPRLYFWRTSAGVEVDLLVDTGGSLVPIEVKLSSTPGYLIHGGAVRLPLASSVTAIPFAVL